MNRLTRHVALLAGSASLSLGVVGVHTGSASGAGAAPSGRVANPYSPAYGHPYRHGAVPTISQNNKMRAYARTHPSTRNVVGPQTLSYGGGIDGIGVTSGTPKVYLVFWGSQWGSQSTDSNGNLTFSNDPSGGAPYIQQMFKGLGTGGELWSGVMTQFCDGPTVAAGATSCPSGAPLVGYPTGGTVAGVWYDSSAAEPSAASGHQIGQEAVNAAGHFGNTTAASNRYAQYDILSPTGLNPDNYRTGGFCAWHDYNGDSTLSGGGVTSPYGDIAFTNMPYVMNQGSSCGQNFVNANGTNDGYSIVNGHEYAELITDQNPAGGWTNQQIGSPNNGQENGDECAWISSGQGASANVSTGTGSFAMQSTWSNDTNRCDISHPIVGGTITNNFSISDNPTSGSVTAGSAVTTTVSTAVTSGSAQTVSLSASGLPTGAAASFNPTSVTAGGSSTLTLSTSASTPAGTYTITITGTGPSASHTTSYSLTVTPSVTNNFSISDNPTSGSVTAGSAATTTVSTAVTSGSAQTVSLSASGLPTGASASFNPTSVTAGGSSTLTLSTSASTPAGTYTITITGTGTSATHTTSYSLTVSTGGGGGGGVTNGGFETGSFAGWTTSGTTAITTSTPHSGTYAALAGSSSPTNGDSSISQTFSVPTGNSTLSFWYNVTCPDSLTYDWATATLRDNTTAATTMPLAKTCVSSSGWALVSAAVTAGHSYTLTLTSHDDNYASDPTFTKFDDVALSGGGGGGGITNGGFETGSFAGWTTSGTTAITTSTPHSGTYAALAGSSSPTNGDSSISQTFSVPTGKATLSFWYNVTCPDSLTYDWATATLRDNTTAATTTPLAKTCVSSSGWRQVSASVTAGHSYTLTLTSHDDNYASDPTFTKFDDAALS